jgi:hypothetical protein
MSLKLTVSALPEAKLKLDKIDDPVNNSQYEQPSPRSPHFL